MKGNEEQAREWLSAAKNVFVMTGAGISAESGIPTFRGKEGLWKDFNPQQLASPEGFERDPALVWEWYAWRLEQLKDAQPNAGHRALVELEKRCQSYLLLTQNVDGLHQAAGSLRVLEIHGNVRRVRDVATGKVYKEGEIEIKPPFPIRTPSGNLARPDVVWYGEMIRVDAVEETEVFLNDSTPQVCLIVGTSGAFPYIQRWALWAKGEGAKLVEVNPEQTPLTEMADVFLEGKAGEILPRIIQ